MALDGLVVVGDPVNDFAAVAAERLWRHVVALGFGHGVFPVVGCFLGGAPASGHPSENSVHADGGSGNSTVGPALTGRRYGTGFRGQERFASRGCRWRSVLPSLA